MSKSSQNGQAILEFILAMLIAVSIVSAFTMGMRRTVGRFWKQLTCEVVAGCPKCQAPEELSRSTRIASQPCHNRAE